MIKISTYLCQCQINYNSLIINQPFPELGEQGHQNDR